MKNQLFERITRYFAPPTRILAMLFALCAYSAANSAFAGTISAVNPVTGETDSSYKYQYVGISTTWTAADWQNTEGVTADKAPNTSESGIWEPLLINGKPSEGTIQAGTIEGYTLRLGLFGGSKASIATLYKFQGGCWIQVDDSSSLTINALGSGTYSGDNNFYVAASSGISFTMDTYNKSGTYNYHLKGAGSVSYKAITGGSHVIKRADVVLTQAASSVRCVSRKKLVAFTSCTPTFTASANVYVTGIDNGGAASDTKSFTSVTQNATTLTSAHEPGTCELVQISSGDNAGLWLYYVENGVSPSPVWKPKNISASMSGCLIDNSNSNWTSSPQDNDDVYFSVTEDCTLTVDGSKTLGNVTVIGPNATADSPVTLTVNASPSAVLSATKITVYPNVILKVSSAGCVNAPVELKPASTLDIAEACTWSQVISGSGSVKVSADAVTFSAANTFTGGLAVVSGGHAKTTNSTGFGPIGSTNITVQNGGALDIASTAGSNYGATIVGEGVLVGDVHTGAMYSSANFGDDSAQWYSITLSGNATIKCNESCNWGLLASGYGTTALSLGSYTLTKAGSGVFWLSYATISGSGTFCVSEGKLRPVAQQNTGSDATILIDTNGQLEISNNSGNYQNGHLAIKNLTCATRVSGNGIDVKSGKTLTVSNAMTVNGSASVAGTLAGAGTATVTSTGTMSLTGSCTITGLKVDREGSITIKDGIDKVPTAVGTNDQVKGTAGTGNTTYAVVNVAKTSDNAEYYTLAEALAAINANAALEKKITLISDTNEPFEIPSTGFKVDTNGKSYTGDISAASGVSVTFSEGVYTGGSYTAASWTGEGSDNRWGNPQNWSVKSVPTSSTTVTFPSGNWTVDTMTQGSVGTVAAMVVDGNVTLQYNSEMGNYTGITLSGNISGSGTLNLRRAGIYGATGETTIAIGCAMTVDYSGSNDSFLHTGTFTLNGTVVCNGLLRCYGGPTFNSDVTVNSGGTLQIDYGGSMNGSLTVKDGGKAVFARAETFTSTVTINGGGKITFSAKPTFNNTASLAGAGDFVLSGDIDETDTFKTVLQGNAWTGTCEIYNNTISGYTISDYGNSGSTVRANYFYGYPKVTSGSSTISGIKALEIVDGGLKFTDTYSGNWTVTIDTKITGSGPMEFATTSQATANYITFDIVGDASEFTGNLTIPAAASSRYAAAVIFRSSSEARITPATHRYVYVQSGAAVNVGSTWDASNGYTIDGVARVSTDKGKFIGSIIGDGTLSYYDAPTMPASGDKQLPYNVPTFGSSWRGNIVIEAMTISNKTNIKLSTLSADNRTIILKGINRATTTTSLYLNDYSIKGTIQVDGPVFITDGNSNKTYTWNRVTGEGNLTATKGAGSASGTTHAITLLDDYTGTLETTTFNLTIGTVNVTSLDLTVGDPLVRLASGCNLTTSPENINVKVANVATDHKLFKAADGNLYIKVASVTVGNTTTYYPTVASAAEAALSAGVTTFTRVDSAAGEIDGWSLSENTYTVYIAEVSGTKYTSLSTAISNAGADGTIKLLQACGGNATLSANQTLDTNGFAYTGKLSGSGKIYYAEKPESLPTFDAEEATKWTGRFVVGWNQTTSAPFAADSYGISGSIVEIPENVTIVGYIPNASNVTKTVYPTLEVAGTLTLDNGYSSAIVNFSKVTGSGTLNVSCIYTHNITTLENWGGTITYAYSSGTASGAITNITSGEGTISSDHAFTPSSISSGWQGTFVVGWAHSSGALDINSYGVSGSTVSLKNVTGGYIPGGVTYNTWDISIVTINPKLSIDGNITFNNGNQYNTYKIPEVSGSGNLTLAKGNTGDCYDIAKLNKYTGKLKTTTSTRVLIGDIIPATALVDGEPIVGIQDKLNYGKGNTSTLLSGTTLDGQTATLFIATRNGELGIYRAVAKVGSLYYATIEDAVDNIGSGYIMPLENRSLMLTDGQSVKIDNSGTPKIEVSADTGCGLTAVDGDGYTTYTAFTATTVTVDGANIAVDNTWLEAAMIASYGTYSAIGSYDGTAFVAKYFNDASLYLTDQGLNGMPRAISYLLGITNPDDKSTAFVMTTAGTTSSGSNLVLTFQGKAYSTDIATVTYSLKAGNNPSSLSAITTGVSVNGNEVVITVGTGDTLYKYYALEMTVVPK